MCFPDNICPVPFDQRPLNEFYLLKSSCFFSFFGFKLRKYIYRLISLFFTVALLFIPIVLSTIKFTWQLFFIIESIYAVVILSLILLRLYLGWSYIIYRLLSATVFYEESGWYDGQIWIKTPEILTKDRLVGTYYILPLLKRIKFTFVILAVLMIMEIFLYCLLC